MKMKKLLAAMMAASVLAASAAGCNTAGGTDSSSSGASSSEISSAVVSLSNTAGSGYSSDNDTKVMEMLEKVTLDGKPLSIPYTLADLPEGYSFAEDVTVYGEEEKYCYSELTYNGESITSITLNGYEDGQSIKDFNVCSIGFFTLVEEKFSDTVQIDGINVKSTMNDVLEKFGEPTTIENGSGSAYIYYYEINDNTYISFWGNEKNEIISMMAYNKV